MMTLSISGKHASQIFADESGGHRWQRVPPTEKRGRVHTSTVTVAVLQEPAETELVIPDSDLEIRTVRGTGPGGQHRNTSDTCVIAKHLPTGIVARSDDRSQEQNRQQALRVLRARVAQREQDQINNARDGDRRSQVGTGMRGDKRRTIRVQDGQVHDHLTGKRWRLRDYLRGEW